MKMIFMNNHRNNYILTGSNLILNLVYISKLY